VEELYLSSAQPGRPKIRYLFNSGRAYPSTHICMPPPSQISPPTRRCPTRPCPLARVDSRHWRPRLVLLRPSQGGAHRPCASQRPAPLARPCHAASQHPAPPARPCACVRARLLLCSLTAPRRWLLLQPGASPTDPRHRPMTAARYTTPAPCPSSFTRSSSIYKLKTLGQSLSPFLTEQINDHPH
jgi:hypothetical protein